MRDFFRGMAAPVRAMRLIASNERLRKLAAMPFTVNVIVFLVGVPLAVWGVTGWVGSLIESTGAAGALLGVLRVLAQIAAVLAVVFLSTFLFIVIGNIIASPFNSKLSEAVEEIVTGRPVASATTVVQDVARSLATSIGRLLLFVALYPPIFLTQFIPVIGFVVQPVLATFYAAMVLSIDFSDFAFERHIDRFGPKVRFVWQRKALYLGFGLTAVAMAIIPFVNFLLLPVGVSGATLLYIEEAERAGRELPSDHNR